MLYNYAVFVMAEVSLV